MGQYIIAGLVLGGIYAISSAGLVVTYVSAGILNFSFGAIAYFVARFFYFLHSQHHWGIASAAVLSLVVVGPALGVLLYYTLFRLLRVSSQLVKIVATLGVSVVIPPAATLMFGNVTILKAPGLAPEPVKVYKFDGVPVTMDQIIVYGCVIAVVILGAVVLRYTDVGLRVRAMVDSPAMTSLSGTNPGSVAVGVWAVSTFLAGLAGVLSAPIIGLNTTDFTLLMAAAFAAVVAAKLRSLPVAVIVSLLMGIAGALVQDYLPPSSSFTAAVIPSIPFVVMALFLLYNVILRGRLDEREGIGGALDRAIAPQGGEATPTAIAAEPAELAAAKVRRLNWDSAVPVLVIVAILPWILHGFWVGLIAEGVAYAVLFLSFTLVIGEGGMIWLCMVTFGGVGAVVAAQFATLHGWPILAAIVVGGIFALPMGLVIGILTIRLGEIYVALVTLTFGLLMDNLVFSRQKFANNGIGVNLNPPAFAHSGRVMVYVCLVVFCIIGLFIVNLRRSTSGLALNAVRWSEPGAKMLGISVLQMKVIVASLAAFVAGVGGALLGVTNGVALPTNYATLGGIIWLAVLVTAGIRSNMAALVAGLMFTIFPGITLVYAPNWVNESVPMLFGFGAIMLAANPEGWVAQNAQQLRTLGRTLMNLARGGGSAGGTTAAPGAGESPAGDVEVGSRPPSGAVSGGGLGQ